MMKTLSKNMKKNKFLFVGFAVLVIAVLAVYSTSLSISSYGWRLEVYTQNQYGNYGDQILIPVGGSSTIQALVFGPPASAYITIAVDGNQIADGLGDKHNNVIELDAPINAQSYAVGPHIVTATATIYSGEDGIGLANPSFSTTGVFYIVDPAAAPAPTPAITPPPTSNVETSNVVISVLGAPPNAQVTITDTNTGQIVLSQSTDNYGQVQTTLGDGTYTATGQSTGYNTASKTFTTPDNNGATLTLNKPNAVPLQTPSHTLNPVQNDHQINNPEAKPWYQWFLDLWHSIFG